jgi:hypothetical protein
MTGSNSFCYASLSIISLPTSDYSHLIFPSSTPADLSSIIASVTGYLDALPQITAAIAPYQPASCSQFVTTVQVGTGTLNPVESSATATLLNPVTHTTVALLVQTGKPVITKVSADAQINTGGGTTTTPTSTSKSPSGNTVTSTSAMVTKTSPVLDIGGSTITAGPSGAFNVAGQTLTPGGSAVVVGGTTISIASGGSVAVINGQTSTLSSTTFTAAQATGGVARVWTNGLALGAFGILGFML